jgi:exodeoxyribonuclease V gamma subunit
MLTIYRGNRAELLAELLATQLRLDPPDPFSTVEVVVNTWPTSRWLGEQLAIQLGGVAANLRFPFPGSHLRRIVAAILAEGPEQAADPWRADRLVWAVLACLPAVAATPQGEPLRRWLRDRDPERQLSLDSWRLARAIADAFDDYTLYRSDLLQAWERGQDQANGSPALAASQRWQPLLYRALRQQLGREPFGLKVERAIACLASRASGGPSARAAEQGSLGAGIVPPLRLFGLSSLAPVQVRLLQAVSGIAAVELFLLTPCPDLWQRCTDRRQRLRDGLALNDPLSSDWLLEAPGLEARFGRLGAEFQQLLEGSGEAQLGETREANLFLLPATAAASGAADPGGEISGAPLLLQLQEQLADPQRGGRLRRWEGDHSLEFHACPGPLRQVQILRDRLLQLLAADPSLEPRDILVMTPQVDRFAPLVAAVLGDSGATGVSLPWRLTDRSQQGEGGIGRCLLTLLEQAGERLTATGLEAILECAPLRQRFGLSAEEGNRLSTALQRCGFRWGLDGRARAGESTHSLAWAIDRLLLGLVLPASPGLALGDPATAPASDEAPLELTGRWLHLLTRLRPWLAQLGRPATVEAWVERLRSLLLDLFADGGDGAAELPVLLAALDSWQEDAGASPLTLEAPVVAAVLQESLGAESGRFGHRSGALTISALEPMRAIPHRVIVLMGLDAGCFPRNGDRAGFHLMEQQRRLGDPQPADQDRYALLEALLSARRNLLVSWSCRDDRKGEALPPAAPVRQWLDWLEANLDGGLGPLLVQHAASPLERTNFLSAAGRPPASCDRRWLEVRRQLDSAGASPLPPLIRRPMPQPAAAVPSQQPSSEEDPFTDLRAWLMEPQRHWLRQLGLRPAERERSVEDLEALALAERERVGLLRAVEGQADAPAVRGCCRRAVPACSRPAAFRPAAAAWPLRPPTSAPPGARRWPGALGRRNAAARGMRWCWCIWPKQVRPKSWSSGYCCCWPAPKPPPPLAAKLPAKQLRKAAARAAAWCSAATRTTCLGSPPRCWRRRRPPPARNWSGCSCCGSNGAAPAGRCPPKPAGPGGKRSASWRAAASPRPATAGKGGAIGAANASARRWRCASAPICPPLRCSMRAAAAWPPSCSNRCGRRCRNPSAGAGAPPPARLRGAPAPALAAAPLAAQVPAKTPEQQRSRADEPLRGQQLSAQPRPAAAGGQRRHRQDLRPSPPGAAAGGGAGLAAAAAVGGDLHRSCRRRAGRPDRPAAATGPHLPGNPWPGGPGSGAGGVASPLLGQQRPIGRRGASRAPATSPDRCAAGPVAAGPGRARQR